METTEYKFLNPQTLAEDDAGVLYKVVSRDGTNIIHEAMNMQKTETIRINESTVADVVYQFDLQAGEYVEKSRTERAEPLPPTLPGPEERIAQLETENAALQQRLAQINGDFTAFTDFYFEKNPTEA